LEGYVDGLEAQLGGVLTGINHDTADVTISSTQVFAGNSSCKSLEIINDSDTTIYFSFGEAAVLYRGFRINAGGGSGFFSRAAGNLRNTAIYAIHGGIGNKRLLINWGT